MKPLIDYALNGIRIDAFPVIDVHAHIDFNTDAVPLDEHLREMDRLGIRSAIASSVVALAGDFEAGNDDVLAAAKRFPGRIFGYCHVSANYPEQILPELKRCFAEPPFKGIKVYQIGVNYDDERFNPAWEFAAANGLPVLAHTWGGNVTGFDKAAERFPTVAFLAGHSGSGFAYQPYIDMAKRSSNFYLDLTYSREHTNMIETIVAGVGARQIVWGTDQPLFSVAHQLGKVLCARIPDEDKRLILGGNAQRLFKIDRG